MDDADRAAKLQQAEIDASMTHRRPTPDLEANGACHWCLAPVGPRQRFCDADCSSDFERDWNRRQQR